MTPLPGCGSVPSAAILTISYKYCLTFQTNYWLSLQLLIDHDCELITWTNDSNIKKNGGRVTGFLCVQVELQRAVRECSETEDGVEEREEVRGREAVYRRVHQRLLNILTRLLHEGGASGEVRGTWNWEGHVHSALNFWWRQCPGSHIKKLLLGLGRSDDHLIQQDWVFFLSFTIISSQKGAVVFAIWPEVWTHTQGLFFKMKETRDVLAGSLIFNSTSSL